jgi:transposase, IS5 family
MLQESGPFEGHFLANSIGDSATQQRVILLAEGKPRDYAMKPRERRETGEQDLFRSKLDQIINMEHELVKLAQAIAWPVIEAKCGAVHRDGPGMPPLPTRLMAGLSILKHTFDLSDEELCARWVENPYFQYLCGEEFFCHALPFDRSSLTRWSASAWARNGS